jgi:transcriptional regulator with XRE-family HTH domain
MVVRKRVQTVSPGEVFQERLRDIRDKRRWSQEDLARAILKVEGKPERENGVDNINRLRVWVARTETGQRKASIDDMFLIAAALDVSPMLLLLPKEGETVFVGKKTWRDPEHFMNWSAGMIEAEDRFRELQAEASRVMAELQAMVERPEMQAAEVLPATQLQAELKDRLDKEREAPRGKRGRKTN